MIPGLLEQMEQRRRQVIPNRHGFRTWLRDKLESNCPLGDLARDIEADPQAPATVPELLAYFQAYHGHVAALLESAVNLWRNEATQATPADLDDVFKETDPGSAEFFHAVAKGVILYDADRQRWLKFQDGRWLPDALAAVRLDLLNAIRTRQRAAIGDGARLKRLVQTENRIPQILRAAEPLFGVRATQFDADGWIVGAPNGTVDLRTGEVRPGTAEDMISKRLGAPWDLESKSPLWERVITHALPDPEVRAFLQRLAGLTLAGLTGENVLPLFYGVTRSSKGTILDAYRSALGDYARTADLSTLARRRFEDGAAPRPDLVDLVGARMVAIYEAGRRFKLDTALVKSLSGSDPIKARTLHEKPIEFRPTFLIWLATDTRPEAPEDDAAFYERLCEVPFNVYLPEAERDPAVRRDLSTPEHGSAVLAWAWHGLQDYLKAKRLTRPQAIQDAGRAFREAMDPLRPFVTECLVTEPAAWTPAGDIRRDYERWCQENGTRPASGKRVAETLTRAGARQVTRSNVRGWEGIRPQKPGSQGAARPGEDQDEVPF